MVPHKDCGPIDDRFRWSVFVDSLIATFGKRRPIVYGDDVDGECLRRRSVAAAVGGSTIILKHDRHRRVPEALAIGV